MFCSNCGSQLPNGASNCPNCGQPITVQTNSFNNNPAQPNQNNLPNNFGQQMNYNNGSSKKNNLPIIIGGIIIIVAVIVIIFFIISSFGTKTITCTQSNNQYGLDTQVEFTTKFKNNKVDNISLVANYKLNSSYARYIDTYYDTVKSQFAEYENMDGVNVNVSKNTDSIQVTINTTRSGAEQFFKTEFYGTDESPDTFIKEAEKQGFTCSQK